MDLNFEGIFLAACTFLIIGLCYLLAIKTGYYFGTESQWLWSVAGIACYVAALSIQNIFWSALLDALGTSLLWGIGELISREKRVLKGQFLMNPKRKGHYEELSKDESMYPCKHKE